MSADARVIASTLHGTGLIRSLHQYTGVDLCEEALVVSTSASSNLAGLTAEGLRHVSNFPDVHHAKWQCRFDVAIDALADLLPLRRGAAVDLTMRQGSTEPDSALTVAELHCWFD